MNIWQYNGSDFTAEDAQTKIDEGYIGFLYIITDASNGKKYVGKKLLSSKKKLTPLKGQKRKRIKIIQSDWESYHGSSESLKEQVALRIDDFHREIIEFAKAKGELSYIEAKYQFEHNVLLDRNNWYNGIISCRINYKHLRALWIN